MKRTGKPQFLLITYADSRTAKKAVGTPQFVAIYKSTPKTMEMLEAIGVELSPTPEAPFYEEEQPIPETIGFRYPQKRSKRPLKRKKKA